MKLQQNRKFSWRPDLPDARDYKYAPSLRTLPTSVDLRLLYKSVYDQGNLGSCTANAIALGFDFERVKQNLSPISPSRLFIYYYERVYLGATNYDSGAYIRDGIKVVNKIGAPKENLWPYTVSKFRVKPSTTAFNNAKLNKAKSYLRLDNTDLNTLKSCLADGYPFIFGFSVYSSFQTPTVYRTGVVPMPGPYEKLLGGHAVLCVGYDDSTQLFICRNSWGSGWGDKGHFYMPYAYLTNNNLADDFWTIRLV